MPLTFRCTRDYGSALPVHGLPHRSLLLALALALACAKGASRPNAPTDRLHFPAWIASSGEQLLVVNLDQNLAYENGAVVALDPVPAASGDPNRPASGLGPGVPVPNMAGKLLVVDAATAGDCAESFLTGDGGYALPFALVAGRFDNALYEVPLDPVTGVPSGGARRIDLHPVSASVPYAVGFSCGIDRRPRAWVSYQTGQNDVGYVSQIDLGQEPLPAGMRRIVQVNTGLGPARSFAYDGAHDRLYFTGKEHDLRAPVRWIDVGSGCRVFANGVQDEREGGCHVDGGFDLSLQLRGAEPNEIALSSAEFPCTSGDLTGNCRRAYLSVRMYDADLAAFLGSRPSTDVGGKLVVLELPEGGLGRPEPQVVADLDIGVMAGELHVIPRSGKRDLVAVTAVDDDLLWLYDDEIGAMVKVFGRDAMGVPALGHLPTGIASRDMGGGVVRLFVTSYEDNWVSAVDVPSADPAAAWLVRVTAPSDPVGTMCPPAGGTGCVAWHLGVTP